MRKLISILFLNFCAVLSSCTSFEPKPKTSLTIDDLENQNPTAKITCFYNYVFVDDETHCGVGLINNKIVTRYEKYEKTGYNTSIFNTKSINKTVFKVTKEAGVPFAYGIEANKSLDYSFDRQKTYRVYLNGDSAESIEILDKEKPSTWIDQTKTVLPSIQDIDNLKEGMSLDEVVNCLGKPQREVGNGAIVFEFDLKDSDSCLDVWFKNDIEKEREYCQENNIEIFGTHFLNVLNYKLSAKNNTST